MTKKRPTFTVEHLLAPNADGVTPCSTARFIKEFPRGVLLDSRSHLVRAFTKFSVHDLYDHALMKIFTRAALPECPGPGYPCGDVFKSVRPGREGADWFLRKFANSRNRRAAFR